MEYELNTIDSNISGYWKRFDSIPKYITGLRATNTTETMWGDFEKRSPKINCSVFIQTFKNDFGLGFFSSYQNYIFG